MRRYLIVANRTLTGPHLIETARARVASGPSTFHVVVPLNPEAEGLVWSEGQAEAHAHAHLEHALASLREAGLQVTGEISSESPVRAVGEVLQRESFDEVIVSTLPPGASRWLKLDLPNRLRHTCTIPVTHVTASTERVR